MEQQPHILVVDDSEDIRLAIQMALRGGGYVFTTAENGRVGLATAFSAMPDLVLLDLHMPEMDGIEVCRQLKRNLSTRNIPVIILTSDDAADMVVKGLEAGADDYLRKPFYPRELQARVSAMLRRTARYVGTDPLTKLPGNALLREELAQRLADERPMAVCYLDLDNFKAYVDLYGFEQASRVIQEYARIAYDAMVEHGGPDDFVGHLGGDDFVLITQPERVRAVCDAIIDAFDSRRGAFYREEDRQRGCIHGPDRNGAERDFPLMTLSVAVLLVEPGGVADLGDLAERAAHAKHAVKQLEGSNWRIYA